MENFLDEYREYQTFWRGWDRESTSYLFVDSKDEITDQKLKAFSIIFVKKGDLNYPVHPETFEVSKHGYTYDEIMNDADIVKEDDGLALYVVTPHYSSTTDLESDLRDSTGQEIEERVARIEESLNTSALRVEVMRKIHYFNTRNPMYKKIFRLT